MVEQLLLRDQQPVLLGIQAMNLASSQEPGPPHLHVNFSFLSSLELSFAQAICFLAQNHRCTFVHHLCSFSAFRCPPMIFLKMAALVDQLSVAHRADGLRQSLSRLTLSSWRPWSRHSYHFSAARAFLPKLGPLEQDFRYPEGSGSFPDATDTIGARVFVANQCKSHLAPNFGKDW